MLDYEKLKNKIDPGQTCNNTMGLADKIIKEKVVPSSHRTQLIEFLENIKNGQTQKALESITNADVINLLHNRHINYASFTGKGEQYSNFLSKLYEYNG